jgi:hypothetical protein
MAISRDWTRSASFPGEIVLLDGLTGTGKTMLMRIIDSYESVSPPRFDYQLEQICIGISEHKIELRAGTQLLQLLIDQRQHDLTLSRELNFRPSDLSSILKSNKRNKYLGRLFSSDVKRSMENLSHGKEKLFLVVHQLLETSTVLDELPNKSLKRVLATRHPFYLFDHWASYVNMHGVSPRDFTITVNKEYQIPWFIKENPEKFFSHSAENKAAIAISELTFRQQEYLVRQDDVLVVDFEKFVLSPEGYLGKLDKLIGTKSKKIAKVLKNQNLPREHVNNSIQKAIYKRYRSSLLTTSHSHKKDYAMLRQRISSSVSKSHFLLLESAANMYEEEFGLWF